MSDPLRAPSSHTHDLHALPVTAADGSRWRLWTTAPVTDFPAGFLRLDACLSPTEALPLGQVEQVTEGLLTLLAPLHARSPSVTHGGVSPARVHLRADGVVALLAPDAPSFDGVALTCGDVGFLSPEFALGRSTPAADVFAVGMTALALAAGAHPRTLPFTQLRPTLGAQWAAAPGLANTLARMVEPLAEHRLPDASAALAFLRAQTASREAAAPVAPPSEFSSGWNGRSLGSARRVPAAAAAEAVTSAVPHARWPVRARASSTYGGGWSPKALEGPPNVFPAYGDRSGAWAPLHPRGGTQWFEVHFDGDGLTSAVWVLETFCPGAIFAVVDVSTGGVPAVLWSGAPGEVKGREAQVFEVRVDPPRRITALRVWLNTDIASGWNEIDTVALLSSAPDPAVMSTTETVGPVGRRRRPAAERLSGEVVNDGARHGTGQRIGEEELHAWGWMNFHHPMYVWPCAASASSTYGGGWSPSAVVGPPKVFPRAGDIQGAWAPKSANTGIQWLDVTFSDDAPAAGVLLVFETHNPGALFAVTVRGGPDDGLVLWKDRPAAIAESPQVLMLELDEPRRITTVRLWIDTSVAASWPEIDTVALVVGRDTAAR